LQADQARNQSRWQQENKSSSQVVAPQLLEVSPDALKKVSDACFGMLRSSFFDPYSVVREGARVEYHAMRHLLELKTLTRDTVARDVLSYPNRGLNITFN